MLVIGTQCLLAVFGRSCPGYVELNCYLTQHTTQTDGQTEAMNKVLEYYHRCFSSDRPKDWVRWLPLAEYS